MGLITRRICSIDCKSGLSPPCIVKIFSSMIAAIGKQLKQSVKVFHNLMLYLRLPGKKQVDKRRKDTSREKERSYIITRTFVIESVNPVDACTLVVPAKNEEVLRVFDLVRE